jgi:hypothetical protein
MSKPDFGLNIGILVGGTNVVTAVPYAEFPYPVTLADV